MEGNDNLLYSVVFELCGKISRLSQAEILAKLAMDYPKILNLVLKGFPSEKVFLEDEIPKCDLKHYSFLPLHNNVMLPDPLGVSYDLPLWAKMCYFLAVKQDKKVLAIKMVREIIPGIHVRDAKEFVDSLMKNECMKTWSW